MEIKLRSKNKGAIIAPLSVRGIENAEKNPKKILAWVKNIESLQRDKGNASVTYSKPMPEVDSLMQEWPPEFEKFLNTVEDIVRLYNSPS